MDLRKRITILILCIILVTPVIGTFSTIPSSADPTNQSPTLSNERPANNSKNVPIDTSTVSVLIEDPEGDRFSWKITTSPNVGSSFKKNSDNGTKIVNLITPLPPDTEIIWYVSVTDQRGSGNRITTTYRFTTQSVLPPQDIIPTQKWVTTSVSGKSRTGPSIADVNNDGRMEIIRSGENGIAVHDGTTGNLIWIKSMMMWDSHCPLEIIDLNKDGRLEIICSNYTGTMALNGKDGSVYWYNPDAPLYNKHPVTGDINADGYPEVFVCTAGGEDGSPLGYVTALTHDGKIFAQVRTYFPCWGGLTLGDTNYDGVFELYMGERNYGYNGTTVGKGVRAFWASNLTERWSHPEMLSSSHCPTLVDTNKDGILDVVALNQGGGIAVFNSADGSVIHQTMSIPNLRCHSQPTIYDIDHDGNLELIACGGDNSWSKPLIWDLYTWKADAWLPFECFEPPAIADIDGDGNVEILASTAEDISIFDHNYQLIGSLPLTNLDYYGMAMILAQDIDNDNLLELVVNRYDEIYTYDTIGAAPTPRALTQFSYYSQHRGRSPYYVEFATISNGGGGSGSDSGGSSGILENIKPIADASAGEPYQEFANSEITFNGSKSYDPDGIITSWSWNFGDHTIGSGKIIEHIYKTAGTYQVILTVTDNEGMTNTDTTTAVVLKENIPPTQPTISGPTFGHKNVPYNFTVMSSDADNNSIRYSIIWEVIPLNESTSTFLPSGTPFICNHRWTAAGIYKISVRASDNITESQPTYLVVLIDIQYVNNLGYLIDRTGDNTSYTFYSNNTMKETKVQKQSNGTYLIDSDGNNEWDYTFDTIKGVSSIPITNTWF